MVGLIYKLYAPVDPDRFYVGSTEMTLKDRLRYHRNERKKSAPVYKHLLQYATGTWQMDLLEECDKTGVELRKLEEFWRVTLRAPLNKNRAYRAPEDTWAANNPELNRAQNRRATAKYKANNMERERKRGREYHYKQKIFPFFRAAQVRAAFQLRIST